MKYSYTAYATKYRNRYPFVASGKRARLVTHTDRARRFLERPSTHSFPPTRKRLKRRRGDHRAVTDQGDDALRGVYDVIASERITTTEMDNCCDLGTPRS